MRDIKCVNDPAMVKFIKNKITEADVVVFKQDTVKLHTVDTVFNKILVVADGHSKTFYGDKLFRIVINGESLHFKIILMRSKGIRMAIFYGGNIKRCIIYDHIFQ